VPEISISMEAYMPKLHTSIYLNCEYPGHLVYYRAQFNVSSRRDFNVNKRFTSSEVEADMIVHLLSKASPSIELGQCIRNICGSDNRRPFDLSEKLSSQAILYLQVTSLHSVCNGCPSY
jgi:hypothetical protein